MDHASQALMRASLHDISNVLAGVRGILELNPVDRPLSPRDRDRLDAVISEGMGILDRARHLAMGTLPGREMESGEEWRALLRRQILPMALLFRNDVEIGYTGDPAADRWPGELLRGYCYALIRHVLPYTQGRTLNILFSADERAWRVQLSPVNTLPDSLLESDEIHPRDISTRWVLRVGSELGVVITYQNERVLASIPRSF